VLDDVFVSTRSVNNFPNDDPFNERDACESGE